MALSSQARPMDGVAPALPGIGAFHSPAGYDIHSITWSGAGESWRPAAAEADVRWRDSGFRLVVFILPQPVRGHTQKRLYGVVVTG